MAMRGRYEELLWNLEARAHGLPDEVAHREHVRTCFGKKPGQETARADHQDELDYMYSTWPDDERFTRPRLDMKEDPHLERDVLDLNDDDKFKVVESDIMVEAAGRRPSGRFCTTMTKVIAAYESRVKPGGLLPGEVALPGEDRNVDNDKHRFADRMFRFQTDLVTVDDNARPAQVALRKWRKNRYLIVSAFHGPYQTVTLQAPTRSSSTGAPTPSARFAVRR
ncbi:Uncharacterized protein PBTT_08340 [Plasmodiophora brassicae]